MAMCYVREKRLPEVLQIKSERRDEVLNTTLDYLIQLGIEQHRRDKARVTPQS